MRGKQEILQFHYLVIELSKMARITRKQISDIDDPDILKHLIIKMGNAQTLEEAVLYLIEADEDEDED